MGLFETIQSAVSVAFTAVGNLKKSIVYVHKQTPSYNKTTGDVTAASGQSSDTFDAVIATASSNAIDNVPVLKNDVWAIVPASAFTSAPKEQDEATFDSITYRVVAVKKIIGGGILVWKLQLRTGK